ncbi:hypothetical protein ACSNOI_19495 [Actinomadura kijaniata]
MLSATSVPVYAALPLQQSAVLTTETPDRRAQRTTGDTTRITAAEQ